MTIRFCLNVAEREFSVITFSPFTKVLATSCHIYTNYISHVYVLRLHHSHEKSTWLRDCVLGYWWLWTTVEQLLEWISYYYAILFVLKIHLKRFIPNKLKDVMLKYIGNQLYHNIHYIQGAKGEREWKLSLSCTNNSHIIEIILISSSFSQFNQWLWIWLLQSLIRFRSLNFDYICVL